MASFGIHVHVFAMLLIAINALATAEQVCYSGQELGGSDGDDPQWVIPHSQPCKCTRILPGGVNVAKSQQGRLVQAPRSKTAIVAADDKSEILTALGCNKQSTEPLTPTLSQSITVVSNSNGNADLVPQNLGSYCPEYDNDISHGTGQTSATIYPLGIPTGIDALCELDSDGRGWIVFQRRSNYIHLGSGQVFDTNFMDYKNGFGSPTDDDFWWGNDNLATVTADGAVWQLRVDLWLQNTNELEYRYVTYPSFSVTRPEYNLSISHFYSSGNLSVNILGNHDGMAFTTRDQGAKRICAVIMGGGWWFQNHVSCAKQINLNAYTPCQATQCWESIPITGELIKSEMKIRHVNSDNGYE